MRNRFNEYFNYHMQSPQLGIISRVKDLNHNGNFITILKNVDLNNSELNQISSPRNDVYKKY